MPTSLEERVHRSIKELILAVEDLPNPPDFIQGGTDEFPELILIVTTAQWMGKAIRKHRYELLINVPTKEVH